MKQKHYHLLRGWLFAACAFFFIIFLLFVDIGENGLGLPFGIFIIVIFAFLSYRHFNSIKDTRQEDIVYAPPTDASNDEKVKYYKRVLYIGVPAFIVVSLINLFNLNKLVSGEVDNIMIWAPVAFLYDKFGYFTAVLSVPLLGILVVILGIRKIKSFQK